MAVEDRHVHSPHHFLALATKCSLAFRPHRLVVSLVVFGNGSCAIAALI